MKKLLRKISSFFLALFILFTGNFAYAVTHNDCITDNDSHYACESDCSNEKQCPDSNETKQIVKQENKKECCEIHDAKILHHEYTTSVFNCSVEKMKLIAISEITFSQFDEPVTNLVSVLYNLNSSDIIIHISALRI